MPIVGILIIVGTVVLVVFVFVVLVASSLRRDREWVAASEELARRFDGRLRSRPAEAGVGGGKAGREDLDFVRSGRSISLRIVTNVTKSKAELEHGTHAVETTRRFLQISTPLFTKFTLSLPVAKAKRSKAVVIQAGSGKAIYCRTSDEAAATELMSSAAFTSLHSDWGFVNVDLTGNKLILKSALRVPSDISPDRIAPILDSVIELVDGLEA